MLSRSIVDTRLPRGIRWDLVRHSFTYVPCADMHQMIFGPDSLHRATLDMARRTLVRTPSEARLFNIAEHAVFVPIEMPRDTTVGANVGRALIHGVSAVTGNTQFEACAALIGLQ